MFKFMEDQSFEREVQSTCSVLFNELLYACTTSELPQFSVCVCVLEWGRSRMLAHFQQRKTGFHLSADHSWGARERERKRGKLLWGIGRGEKRFLDPHLNADDTLWHYTEGRCGYWHVNARSVCSSFLSTESVFFDVWLGWRTRGSNSVVDL